MAEFRGNPASANTTESRGALSFTYVSVSCNHRCPPCELAGSKLTLFFLRQPLRSFEPAGIQDFDSRDTVGSADALGPCCDLHQSFGNCCGYGSLNYVGSDPRTFRKFAPGHLTAPVRQDSLHNSLKYGKFVFCLKLVQPCPR